MEEEVEEEKEAAGRHEVQTRTNEARMRRMAAAVVMEQLTMYRRRMRLKMISILTTRY